jgi:DNA invertase Pin-like site-specific DNA recombinase
MYTFLYILIFEVSPMDTGRSQECGSRFVGYIRVSTTDQEQSGLGLEAQRQAVGEYACRVGGEVVSEFVEVESGGRSDRPELAKALEVCRRHRAILIIAKLDRLAGC